MFRDELSDVWTQGIEARQGTQDWFASRLTASVLSRCLIRVIEATDGIRLTTIMKNKAIELVLHIFFFPFGYLFPLRYQW